MDVTPLIKANSQIIQNYNNGGFKVSGIQYETSIIVTAQKTTVWDVPRFSDMTAEGIDNVLKNNDKADVVLLGCGASIAFLPKDIRKDLQERGISVDIMDTGAACRTYNVLMAEGRRVIALLFPA